VSKEGVGNQKTELFGPTHLRMHWLKRKGSMRMKKIRYGGKSIMSAGIGAFCVADLTSLANENLIQLTV
jgi:hypothetical protein